MRARETQKFAFFFHFLPPQEEHLSISTTRAPPLAAFFAATGAAFFFSIFFLAGAFLAEAFLAPPLVRVVAIALDVDLSQPFFLVRSPQSSFFFRELPLRAAAGATEAK